MPPSNMRHPAGRHPRPRPRTSSDYDNRIHSRTDERRHRRPAPDPAGKRRDDDQADRRPSSRPTAAAKNANPKVPKSSAGQALGQSKKKVKRRDVAAPAGEPNDGLESLRPGTKYRNASDRRPRALAAGRTSSTTSVRPRLQGPSPPASRRRVSSTRSEILPENAAGLSGPTPSWTAASAWQALKHNGETEVRVLVRYDLAEADRDTIELEFLATNKERRHLDKLEKARVALRQYEIEKNRKGGKLFSFDKEKARELLGKEST